MREWGLSGRGCFAALSPMTASAKCWITRSDWANFRSSLTNAHRLICGNCRDAYWTGKVDAFKVRVNAGLGPTLLSIEGLRPRASRPDPISAARAQLEAALIPFTPSCPAEKTAHALERANACFGQVLRFAERAAARQQLSYSGSIAGVTSLSWYASVRVIRSLAVAIALFSSC